MHDLLEKLAVLLEEELDRQRRVLEALKAQHAAIGAQDPRDLQEQTKALRTLTRESAKGEARRMLLMRQVGHLIGLEEDELRMSRLLAKVPEEWRARLEFYQSELKGIVMETQRVLHSNNRVIQGSLRHLEGVFMRPSGVPRREGYTAQGHQTTAQLTPVLLNQEG